tara:strand:- start:60 stop:812 length:753 start_codon:yes stop_codon:yes gene_type:complete
MDNKPKKKYNLKIVEPIKIKKKKKLKIVEPIKIKVKRKKKQAPAPEPPAKLPFNLLFNDVFGDINLRQQIFRMKEKPSFEEDSIYMRKSEVEILQEFINDKSYGNAVDLLDELINEDNITSFKQRMNSMMTIETGKIDLDEPDGDGFGDATIKTKRTIYTKEMGEIDDDDDYPIISNIEEDREYFEGNQPYDTDDESIYIGNFDDGYLKLVLSDLTKITPSFEGDIKNYLEEAKNIVYNVVESRYMEDND